MNLSDYATPKNFLYWLSHNFDGDEIQGLLDSAADDEVYPEEFIQYCYDAMAFDHEKTVYPVLATAFVAPDIGEEEEIDHEFHFMEVPLHDDSEFNKEI